MILTQGRHLQTKSLKLLFPSQSFPYRSQASRDSEDTIASAESTKLIREELLTGFSLFCCQLVGLLKKRWLHNVRDWRYFLSTFLLPTILLVVSMWLSLMRPVIEIPPILLNPSMHGPNSYSFMQ